MATITLKNIPERLYERLKYLAKVRHRSLNSEIIYNLERSTGLYDEDPKQIRELTDAFRDKISKRGLLTSDEVENSITGGKK